VRADEHLKERYLERSLEKIQRMLRRPVWQLKDTLIIGLLTANLLALIFLRPGPSPTTAGGKPVSNDKEIKLLTEMSARLTALEEHLQAMQVIDEELMTSPSPTAASSAPPPATPPGTTPGKARSHKVKSGDTLGKICEKYYGTSDPKILKGLARANGLKSPNYDLFLGETLKIPDKKDLK
jgi:LysM repeat protein